MAKRNMFLYAAVGLLGAAGFAAGYALTRRKKDAPAANAPAAEPPRPDEPPGFVLCSKCENKFKEYELFCPYCQHPNEPEPAKE